MTGIPPSKYLRNPLWTILGGLILLVCLVFLSGCSTVAPQRGGVATIGKAILSPFKAVTEKVGDLPRPAKNNAPIAAGDGSLASITQPDNPAQTSAQNYEVTREEEIVFSAPTKITEQLGETVRTIEVPAGSKKLVKETQKVGQSIGAAQKDTARETSALLGSFKWVQGLGVLVMLIGVVGFAHPAARLLIGGKDTAMVVGLVGLGMIVGPFLLVQYANWFALLVVLAALYWGVARLKYKEAEADTLKSISTPPFPK